MEGRDDVFVSIPGPAASRYEIANHRTNAPEAVWTTKGAIDCLVPEADDVEIPVVVKVHDETRVRSKAAIAVCTTCMRMPIVLEDWILADSPTLVITKV